MQARLRAAGVRPISNIVDVTNYVLIELGQPMHAFDLARLGGGQIRVRTAQAGETLRTLDGQMRTLTPEMLVIADAERAGGDRRCHGRCRQRGHRRHADDRARERVLRRHSRCGAPARRSASRRRPASGSNAARTLACRSRPWSAPARSSISQAPARPGARSWTDIPLRVEPVVLRLRRGRVAGLLGVSVPDARRPPDPREPGVRRARRGEWVGRHRAHATR